MAVIADVFFLGFLYAAPLQLYSTICFVEQKSERAGLQEKIVSPPRAWPGEGVEGRAAGRGVCFLRLSQQASGLAQSRQAAQLDGDISFHCSRRRLRDWPRGRAEGRAAGRGILLYASRQLLAWPIWGGGGGAHVDMEFAFLSFSPPTSSLAWMGLWRGALPWCGVCLSIFHSLASRLKAKLCSVTGPNTI